MGVLPHCFGRGRGGFNSWWVAAEDADSVRESARLVNTCPVPGCGGRWGGWGWGQFSRMFFCCAQVSHTLVHILFCLTSPPPTLPPQTSGERKRFLYSTLSVFWVENLSNGTRRFSRASFRVLTFGSDNSPCSVSISLCRTSSVVWGCSRLSV